MDYIKRGMKEIPLKSIIMEAGYNLASYVQWSKNVSWEEHRTEYYYSAKCLIELAETMVCGSVGGFDAVKIGKKYITQQGNSEDSCWSEASKYDDFFARWLWLFTFYHGGNDKTNIGPAGWYKVKDLKKFFRAREE